MKTYAKPYSSPLRRTTTLQNRHGTTYVIGECPRGSFEAVPEDHWNGAPDAEEDWKKETKRVNKAKRRAEDVKNHGIPVTIASCALSDGQTAHIVKVNSRTVTVEYPHGGIKRQFCRFHGYLGDFNGTHIAHFDKARKIFDGKEPYDLIKEGKKTAKAK